jgi:chromosome segregation protein
MEHMRLTSLEISGFKSFAKKDSFSFETPISSIVGPNGSGKSNVAEAFRFVLGEQSLKSMRGKKGEDMIFNGTTKIPRQNKASVKITFDNRDRLLKLDLDEVIIERVVHRDGQNEYLINGSKVRLKDVQELLAGANIGSTGHHIISQGEADRILNTSNKERKEMLEDALGLRLYQYRKQDSEKKLEKTAENIAQVESLRREIAPHLRFLKKQVEKVEKAIELRREVSDKYQEYLSKEFTYIQNAQKELSQIDQVKEQLAQLNSQIESFSTQTSDTSEEDGIRNQMQDVRTTISKLKDSEYELVRMIAGLEGQIKTLNDLQNAAPVHTEEKIVLKKSDVEQKIAELKSLQFDSIDAVKNQISRLITFFESFISGEKKEEVHVPDLSGKISVLEKEIADQKEKIEKIRAEIEAASNTQSELQTRLQDAQKPVSNVEIIQLMNQKTDLSATYSSLQYKQRELQADEEEFNREVQEAIVLAGRMVSEYAHKENLEVLSEQRMQQKERRRALERLKIRLEEMGVGASDDVMKEYQEAVERDEFLRKELEDLLIASQDLQKVIEHLNVEIAERFGGGLEKINTQFSKFFSVMFDGGEASLKLEKKKISGEEDAEEVFEEGLDIDVNLPRKKVRSLMMLSGGERALTSIALLFAMSSVNPPPFIILDETDAALDEANSKRYGDMIENLAKHSQLILITHNRETMSRAGVIFGITMTDGASKVLSIKFEEAVLVAK